MTDPSSPPPVICPDCRHRLDPPVRWDEEALFPRYSTRVSSLYTCPQCGWSHTITIETPDLGPPDEPTDPTTCDCETPCPVTLADDSALRVGECQHCHRPVAAYLHPNALDQLQAKGDAPSD